MFVVLSVLCLSINFIVYHSLLLAFVHTCVCVCVTGFIDVCTQVCVCVTGFIDVCTHVCLPQPFIDVCTHVCLPQASLTFVHTCVYHRLH